MSPLVSSIDFSGRAKDMCAERHLKGARAHHVP
jgi:hypothetical protein